jgi:outer membrane protein TolC
MRQSLLVLYAAVPLLAQSPLTLQDAVRMAVEKHPAVEATELQTRAAASRITEARSGYLPRLNYTESWTRSNNPVFVFSSLLSQHQFTESNFAIGPLNRPGFLNNFQSQVAVDQMVYDWGATGARVRGAELGRQLSQEQERRTRMELMTRVVRAYHAAVLAQASLDVAREALKSAEADAQRAEAIRQAGMSTDADLLSIRVHLASVREHEIRRGYDVRVAFAALNEALGLPLETQHQLTTPLEPGKLAADQVAQYETAAAQYRPELNQAQLAIRMAEQHTTAARSALLPQFEVRGAFEANRQEFVNKGGANWLVAASMRWNLFDGLGNRARISEANASLAAARAQERQASSGVKFEVYRAWADARAAEERLAVTAAAVAEAEESLRITKNRYENGLTTVTDLLRNETALLEARTRRLAAIHDQRIAMAALELAAGTLSADSEILK